MEQVWVYGNSYENFLVGVAVPDKGELQKWAKGNGASSDLKELWEGAMFMTEKQGGSDVGANLVRAEQKDGKWFLTGDKWFCSNADAGAILALARMPARSSARCFRWQGPTGGRRLPAFQIQTGASPP